VRRIVFADQRLRVDAHSCRDRADVAACIEITAARTELILLDGADQGLPDPGLRADLRDGQPRVVPRLGQRLADGHICQDCR